MSKANRGLQSIATKRLQLESYIDAAKKRLKSRADDVEYYRGVVEQRADDAQRFALERDEKQAETQRAASQRPDASAFTGKWAPYEGDKRRLAGLIGNRMRGQLQGVAGDVRALVRPDLGRAVSALYEKLQPNFEDVARVSQNRGGEVLGALQTYNAALQKRDPSGRFGPKNDAAVTEAMKIITAPPPYMTSVSQDFMKRVLMQP